MYKLDLYFISVASDFMLCCVNFHSAFITGLLNNVGTHIDPTKLIKVSRLCVCMSLLFVCLFVCLLSCLLLIVLTANS